MAAPVHSQKVQAVFDWLVDGAPGASTPMAVIGRLCGELSAAGVPLDRVSAFVRTLHPHSVGRRFLWQPGMLEAEVSELPWAGLDSASYKLSPVLRVYQSGAELRLRLDGSGPLEFPELEELKKLGLTDYLCAPLKFMGGSIHAITFATAARGGFTDQQLAELRHVVRPLARVGEALALMRTTVNLLNTYVGRGAGDRILSGHIQRGDIESIRCVIWFSDLRGFTSLSGERTPAEIIGVLNEFFECQVAAIERHGGEVLKFIGDGLLAIFPLDEKRAGAAAAEAGVTAAQQAFAALEVLNQTRAGRGEAPLAFGVALHVGDVAYGNIGGASRLDFTAIGPAVNLASRIESLTGKLHKQVLVSEAVARLLTRPTRSVGTFELKGVALPQAVYEPA